MDTEIFCDGGRIGVERTLSHVLIRRGAQMPQMSEGRQPFHVGTGWGLASRGGMGAESPCGQGLGSCQRRTGCQLRCSNVGDP